MALWLRGAGLGTDFFPRGTARGSVEGCGIQTGRGFPRLHEVSQDPEDLRGIRDDGDDNLYNNRKEPSRILPMEAPTAKDHHLETVVRVGVGA
jgi:hypothetical protein